MGIEILKVSFEINQKGFKKCAVMQFPSNRVDNGYVSSGFLAFPLTNRLPVNGSFYNDLLHSFKTQIEKNGDWLWLKDYCTGDTFMASEFEPLSKKSVYLHLHLLLYLDSRPFFDFKN